MTRASFLLTLASPLYTQISERARRFHDQAFVFDGHIHVIDLQFYRGGDIGDRVKYGQFDLPRAREGGLDAMFFSIFVPEDYYPQRFETKQTFRLLDLALTQLHKNRNTIALALNATDIQRINRQGKIAAVLDLEGSFDLDGDPGIVRDLYRLGMRSLQLSAHNWTSNYADSCCSPPRWHGLNERGRAVVREMNRLGMVINVSHASDDAISQAVDVSADPVVATHHGLRSLNNIPRNLPDWLAKKIAAKGGVIGVQIGNEFHNPKMFRWRTEHAGKAFWDTGATKKSQQLTIDEVDRKVAPRFPMVGVNCPENLKMTPYDWVGVVDRLIELVGEDHVALGSDLNGGPTLPRGMRDIRDLPMITEAMMRRGYSEERMRKFWGGNLLRVLRQITEKQKPAATQMG